MTSSINVQLAGGELDRTVDLPAETFDVQVNVPLIHQVVVAQLAAARRGTAGRQDPRRGFRWRQEAVPAEGHRPGPSGFDRAPQFAGGGVVHGPTPRSYVQRTPKKMKAAALRGALSDRARAGRVHVVGESGRRVTSRPRKTALASLEQDR